MMVQPQWTGWSKNKKEGSPSHLLPRPVLGNFQQNKANPQRCKRLHFNIIDTPGHVDFTVEVNRHSEYWMQLVFLFSAVDGVEPQSETNWRLADNYKCLELGL